MNPISFCLSENVFYPSIISEEQFCQVQYYLTMVFSQVPSSRARTWESCPEQILHLQQCNREMNAHGTQPTGEGPALKFRPLISRDFLLSEIISRLMASLMQWLLAHSPRQQATGVTGLVDTRFSLGVVKATLPNEKQCRDQIQETSPVGNTLVKETDK